MLGGPKSSELWTNSGFYDKDHGARDISRHELNTDDVNVKKDVIRWIRRGGGGERIDKKLAALENVLVEQNRHVARCMLDCAKYIATEMMAFQDHSSKLGKFVNLFRLVAKHNTYAHTYLEIVKRRITCHQIF